jgi:penicillin-binding protein 1C
MHYTYYFDKIVVLTIMNHTPLHSQHKRRSTRKIDSNSIFAAFKKVLDSIVVQFAGKAAQKHSHIHHTPHTTHRRTSFKRIFNLKNAAIGFFVLLFLLFTLYWYFAKDLPEAGKITSKTTNSTIYYDRDGGVLYESFKDKNRVAVEGKDINDWLKKATISIEDKDFYKHRGFDPLTIIRIPYNYIFKSGRVVGGSTLTQQLVKTTLLDGRRTATRKVKELILALEIERRFNKDQILSMYLNEVPYGGTYYGIGSAAKGYFNKDPKDLNLLESAILAGLPQNPTTYSPFIGKKDAWKTRTKFVLLSMAEQGYITKEQQADSVNALDGIQFNSERISIEAPHFVFFVKEKLEKILGADVVNSGIKITTTLNKKIQNIAQESVTKEVEKLKTANVSNGAAVVLDPRKNEILAMVGSSDFEATGYGKFNVVNSDNRLPGSTLKPFLYAMSFEKDYDPTSILADVKTTFPIAGSTDYNPENYDRTFHGIPQFRFDLGNSYNIPTVKLGLVLGIDNFLIKMNELGIVDFYPNAQNIGRYGPAVTLGGVETSLLRVGNAYSTLARQGEQKEVQYVLQVTDYKGNVLYKPTNEETKTIFTKEASFITSHILTDNNARTQSFGPSSLLNIPGKTVAVKTGTTNEKRDNWCVGFTKGLVVGAWVGNNDNTKMNDRVASGITGATPIWHNITKEVLSDNVNFPDGILEKPENVVALEIDATLGGLPRGGANKRTEYFIKGKEPTTTSKYLQKIKVSKRDSGKLANSNEIGGGNYEEKEFAVFTEVDPISKDGKNRWQDAINEWTKTQGDLFKVPTEVQSETEDVSINLITPRDGETKDSKTIEYRVKIFSTPKIKEVKLIINGSEVKAFGEGTMEVNEQLTFPSSGEQTILLRVKNEKDKVSENNIKIRVP